jgi:hypothetical protein
MTLLRLPSLPICMSVPAGSMLGSPSVSSSPHLLAHKSADRSTRGMVASACAGPTCYLPHDMSLGTLERNADIPPGMARYRISNGSSSLIRQLLENGKQVARKWSKPRYYRSSICRVVSSFVLHQTGQSYGTMIARSARTEPPRVVAGRESFRCPAVVLCVHRIAIQGSWHERKCRKSSAIF